MSEQEIENEILMRQSSDTPLEVTPSETSSLTSDTKSPGIIPFSHDVDQQPHPEDEQSQENTINDKSSPKAKKSVGFAPPPEEDLKLHHSQLKSKQEIKAKSSPFHKIPPELAYLEKKHFKTYPKSLVDDKLQKPNSRFRLTDLPDLSKLKFFDVKNISVQNKETELQFHYKTIKLPPVSNSVIVDMKYSSLNSYDIYKINQYLLNLSNVEVGLGFEFSGVITYVGSSIKDYQVGDFVFGLIDPLSKRGALSSSQIIYPHKDVLIKIDEQMMDEIDKTDIKFNFEKKEFQIDENESEISKNDDVELPGLAKLASTSLLYNHAKQFHRHFKPLDNQKRYNVLINGGDTNLGLTLLQLFLIDESQIQHLNIILIIKESSIEYMKKLADSLTEKFYNPQMRKTIHILPYDSFNDGLYFAGEKIPINYKKPDFFATELFSTLLTPTDENEQHKISTTNINDYKIDMFIDLVGCKKYFQHTISKLDQMNSLSLPFHKYIDQSASLSTLFGSNSEHLLNKVIKPKKFNSVVISGCNFYLNEPSYDIDKLIDFNKESYINPWTSKWSSNLFNNWTQYNYIDEKYLKISKKWCLESLDLVLNNKLKFKIDVFDDWRNDYKQQIKRLRHGDGKIIYKIEQF